MNLKTNKIRLDFSYIPPSSAIPPPRPSPQHKLDKNTPSSDESKNNSMINYKLIAERLWGILDDIDTAFDHYKPDMKDRFAYYVSEKSKERGLYANSLDGQTLTFNKDIPILEDLDPMSKWFKDAWLLEKELKNKPEVDIPKIPVTEEENIEVKLHNTTDAQVWTDDFFKTFGKVYPDIIYCINSLLPKERLWEYPDTPEQNKWTLLFPFDCMQKSFAEGAWSMLKSCYNQNYKHRLVKDGQVIDECGYQKIKVN